MVDIPQFSCSACGKCCSNIRGFISEEEKAFLEEFGKGKLPLIQLTSAEQMTFPLWDFEAKRFFSYEREVDIDAKIVPSRGVYDLQSNRFIVVTYQMQTQGACPFLADSGKCSIYHTKRAYICHLFPFNRSPYLPIGEENYRGIFGVCPSLQKFQDQFDYDNKETLIKQLHSSFGESFLHAVQHDYLLEWSNKVIMELMKERRIKPALNYPYEFLKKRISNSKHIDFSDFLVECGYVSADQMKEMIEEFEGLKQAREKVEQN